ncbi:MAG: hypothetical protein M0R20_06530 [Candidatus Omnitrophica bacterium]|jgi:hypothetical protein|nr:hypothetical protein [Candidatus Omnitrophota bacterium]
MSYQHKGLAAGRWSQLSFLEQMANIGSEVERALNWRAKHNVAYCRQAFERSLELIDLTLDSVKGFARLKELARLRETIADYFFGTNQFVSTEESLKKYFLNFTYAARRNH